MKRFISFNLPVATIAIVSSLGIAEAATVKTFSAASCTTDIGNTTVFGISNASFTKSAKVLCPLVRDNPNAAPTKIEASVVDNSTVLPADRGNVKCTATSVNRFGTSGSHGVPESTSGTNPSGTILNLAIPPRVVRNGALVVRCVLPRRSALDAESSIGSIKLTEP